MYHFLLVALCNNVSILHHFRHITSFTVYVTACDLESPYCSLVDNIYNIVLP